MQLFDTTIVYFDAANKSAAYLWADGNLTGDVEMAPAETFEVAPYTIERRAKAVVIYSTVANSAAITEYWAARSIAPSAAP